jgi:hypothetical protein
MRIIPSELLSSSDLVIDAVYEGGASGNAADDPISKIYKELGTKAGFALRDGARTERSLFSTRAGQTRIGLIRST